MRKLIKQYPISTYNARSGVEMRCFGISQMSIRDFSLKNYFAGVLFRVGFI